MLELSKNEIVQTISVKEFLSMPIYELAVFVNSNSGLYVLKVYRRQYDEQTGNSYYVESINRLWTIHEFIFLLSKRSAPIERIKYY